MLTMYDQNRPERIEVIPGNEARIAFYRKYVDPHGDQRLESRGDPIRGLSLAGNESAIMELILILVNVVSNKNGMWDFREKELMKDGVWIGDTEPGSSNFALATLETTDSAEPFIYTPPVPAISSNGNLKLEWRTNSQIKVVYTRKGGDWWTVLGNRPGFFSLGMHLATLAQIDVPHGATIRYEPGRELLKDSLPLVIAKRDFPTESC